MSEKDLMPFFYKKLGMLIKEARLLRQISQEELAKRIQLSRVSVVNIEKGIQKVQVHTLVQISNILELNLNDLKLLTSSETNKSNLDKNYLNRIEQSEVDNLKSLIKNFQDLKKHL